MPTQRFENLCVGMADEFDKLHFLVKHILVFVVGIFTKIIQIWQKGATHFVWNEKQISKSHPLILLQISPSDFSLVTPVSVSAVCAYTQCTNSIESQILLEAFCSNNTHITTQKTITTYSRVPFFYQSIFSCSHNIQQRGDRWYS